MIIKSFELNKLKLKITNFTYFMVIMKVSKEETIKNLFREKLSR